jgi:hypothetical protein
MNFAESPSRIIYDYLMVSQTYINSTFQALFLTVLSQQLSASAVLDHEALLVPLAIIVYPKPVWALQDLHRIDAEQRLHLESEAFHVIRDAMDNPIHHCMIDFKTIS